MGPDRSDGNPENVFAGREGERVYAADGGIIRGRDRYSIAELSQFALEWRGQFLEDKFTATVGVRAPVFTRELNQYCYTPNGGTGNSANTIAATNGGTLCTARTPTSTLPTATSSSRPTRWARIAVHRAVQREVKFDDILPNVGLSFTPWDNHMFYLSYAEGLSAPRTDNLYSVRRLADGCIGRPTPESETTDVLRHRLAPEHRQDHRLGGVVEDRLHQSHRVVVRSRPRLQRRPQRR